MRGLRRITRLPAVASLFVVLALPQAPAPDAALLEAIQRSDLDAVERALREGANVSGFDKTGATMLMDAAIYSTAACLRLLLDRGADPNATNAAGATALMWSAGDPGKLRVLLAKGAAVNAQANSGRTALSVAASMAGNIDGVRLLLAKGADATLKRAYVVTAAASSGDHAILQATLAAGGDPSEQLPNGLTPLILASRRADVAPVRMLLDAGADVNARTNPPAPTARGLAEQGGITALMMAASFGNSAVVKLLIDRGADVHARDLRQMTPLMMAAASEFQDEQTGRILIEAGADIRAVAKDGQTVSGWARKFGAGGVLKLLKEPAAAPVTEPVKLLDTPREPDIRRAVEKTIALLQSSSTEYFRNSGCTGCHHQMLTGMAVGLARQRGLNVSDAIAKVQVKGQVSVVAPQRDAYLQGLPVGGAPMSVSLLLVSLAAQEYPSDQFTASLAQFLAGFQSEDGSWRGPTVRPPIQYSEYGNTAYAIRALQYYGPPGRKEEYSRRIERARAWLQTQKPSLNEDRVKRLLGLSWAGAGAGALQAAASVLLAEQRADGGWAQRPELPSDAYATGQTLYALNQAGEIRPKDPRYAKGVSFLRRTQLADGSWHVRSRSLKFQPYFESGFPHGHDQWISAAASAWAAMALTLAADETTVAARKH